MNVISKSGTTLEPAISFRVFRTMLEKKYGSAAKRHIFATTDVSRGVLRTMANAEGWECFTVPGDVGGRYSVLSAVGLLAHGRRRHRRHRRNRARHRATFGALYHAQPG